MFVKLIDKQFEKLGYQVTEWTGTGVRYEKEEFIGRYLHVIDIYWKKHLNTFCVQSYEKGTNSDRYNNCVQLTKKEIILIYLRMWFM